MDWIYGIRFNALFEWVCVCVCFFSPLVYKTSSRVFFKAINFPLILNNIFHLSNLDCF